MTQLVDQARPMNADPAPTPLPVAAGTAGEGAPVSLGAFDARDWSLLQMLRALAQAAECRGRIDPDRACALIAPPAEAAVEAYGTALLRLLDVAAGQGLHFHRRGAPTLAFGEAWLLRLVTACARGDADSATFLVSRLVARPHRRAVLWLAHRLADAARAGHLPRMR